MDVKWQGVAETLMTLGSGAGVHGPVFVVVDGGSASASEMLVSAVRQQGRGLIVGANTRGKGVVQGTFALHRGCGVAITTATVWPVGGSEWWGGGRGIAPDVAVAGNLPLDSFDVDGLVLAHGLRRADAAQDRGTGGTSSATASGRISRDVSAANGVVQGGGEGGRGGFKCPAFWACGWGE